MELLEGEKENIMNKTQKFTPKYWVVHKINSDDIKTYTMNKNMQESIQTFLETKFFAEEGEFSYEDLWEYWYEQEDYVCELVEVRLI